MIEAGLIIFVMMAMFMAIIDYSIAFFIQATFRHAAREGTRFAITNRTIGGGCHVDSIKSVVRQNAMGFLRTTDLQKIKVQYFNPATQQAIVNAGANNGGNIVMVTISPCELQNGSDCFTWNWVAPFMRQDTPMRVRARSADVMEAPQLGVLPCV